MRKIRSVHSAFHLNHNVQRQINKFFWETLNRDIVKEQIFGPVLAVVV